MDELISVIVPIYNVEKYLRACIESIINQTYKNIEIILVDDGSPDKCPNICDNYKKNDKRIRVIHKKNGGLSDARNAGIDNVSGKYICFVDSDDYIEIDYIEKLYNSLKKNNTKIAQCGINYVDENNKLIKSIGYSREQVKSGRNMLLDINDFHEVENTVVWNRLYDISLFKNIRFPFGKIHEDEFVTYLLYYENNVSIINDNLYNYRQTPNSIMNKNFNLKRLDALDAYKEKLAYFKEIKDSKLYYNTIITYLYLLRKYYIQVRKYYRKEENILNNIVSEFRIKYKEIIKRIPLKKKIKLGIFYINPLIYYYLKKVEE